MELLIHSSSSAFVCSARRNGSGPYLSLPGAMLHLTDCCLDFMLLVCSLITQCGFSLLGRQLLANIPPGSWEAQGPGPRRRCTHQPSKGTLVQLVPLPSSCEFSLCCRLSPGFCVLSFKLEECTPFLISGVQVSSAITALQFLLGVSL